jgi:hypothetical protein
VSPTLASIRITGSPWLPNDAPAAFAIAKGVTFEFRADVLNAFNNINFLGVASASSSATMGQVTSAYQDTNNTQDPGGRLVQLGFRINW